MITDNFVITLIKNVTTYLRNFIGTYPTLSEKNRYKNIRTIKLILELQIRNLRKLVLNEINNF